MLYVLMLVTAFILWRTLEIHLFIAALASVVFWSIVGPIISAIISVFTRGQKGGKEDES